MTTTQTRIYIVDDDPSFGKSLKRLLDVRGIPAEYFGSAQSFLDSVPADAAGYAIVDIQMPDCDGFALMDRMRDAHYDMATIVITGHAQADVREQAMQKGAAGFLQKPFSEESLIELLS